MFDNRFKQGTTLEVFPPPEGVNTYVKLPSRATVSDVEFDIEHPLLPTYQESLFTSDNTIEVANAYAYNYKYDYYTSTDSWYGYGYYYPKEYHDYTDAYFMNNIYTGYPYTTTSYDRYISYLNRGYLAWDLDHSDFAVPPGATILQYDLNYPIRRYHYSSSYGFEWESNPPSNYFSAAKDWGAFAVTSEHPNTFSYVYDEYSYDYYYMNPWEDYFPDWYNDYLPGNRTTPVDTYEMEDHFYTTSYEDLYDVSYDLSDLYQEWTTGSLDNNGVMITMYQTDYSDEPHFEEVYAYYNDDMISSQAWSKNCFYFTYSGYTYNPLYTASTSYQRTTRSW